MDTVSEKPRWEYRFENYTRAFLLLREAVELHATRALSSLEKEGMIQRFEYTWELAWKTLKDYLEYQGILLPTITPTTVIRAASEAKLIVDAEGWMRALDARNAMSHSYDAQRFDRIIADIQGTYYPLLDDVYLTLLERLASNAAHV